MRTVRDESGKRYLLVKEATDAWLVRDPATGAESYLPADRLEAAGEEPLETAAAAAPPAVRRVVAGVPEPTALGLLVAVVDRGPVPARDLLAATDRCESDLVGMLSALRAAGLVAETTVGDAEAYRATEAAEDGVAALRSLREASSGTGTEPTPE